MLGPVFYLLFYLGTGIIASLVHIFISGPDSTIPSVGASEGVMGGYLVLFPGQQVHVLLPDYGFRTGRMSAVALLGFWFVLQFLTGIAALTENTAETGGVAVWAHIGGFVAGAFIGFLLRGRTGPQRQVYAR